jgi:hypothetical protein
MNSNKKLIAKQDENISNTYFIHIKKSNMTDLDDLNMIKSLLNDEFSFNNENIQLSDFKFIDCNDLKNKSYKQVGKYLKSNKSSCCELCKKTIKQETTFKQLNCGHRFHTKCIDPILKQDIYKKCTSCCSENITCLM